MERSRFLARVASSLSSDEVPEVPDGPVLRKSRKKNLSKQFIEAATEVGVSVESVSSGAEVREAVLRIAGTTGAESFIAWDEAYLGVLGVVPFLEVAGLRCLGNDGGMDRQAFLDEVEGADLGVTGSLGGIAESGTVILDHGDGRPRVASLLPPVHIAIVREDQLHASFVSYCADNPDALEGSSNQVFVTGPSRTGDIEMILTLGVHGPREVHILLMASS